MARQSSRLGENDRNSQSRAPLDRGSNVLGFNRPSSTDRDISPALNLVYQAVDAFSEMEEHALEIEARAQFMCKSATERLQFAEQRTEAAERRMHQVIFDAECKLQNASNSLKQAEARITAAEDQVIAFEVRAQAAEAQLREVERAFQMVEETIRRHTQQS